MKIISHVALFVLLATFSFGREIEKVELYRLDQFEKSDWASLSFGFGQNNGDYYSYGQRIVLQRLPDNRVLLSWIKDGEHGLPVAKRFLSLEQAETIRKRIADLHRIALAEDSKDSYTDMHLKVTKADGDNCGASSGFDIKKKTLKEFEEYFESLLKIKASEQDGADQPATRPESKSEGSQKPQPDPEGRSR